MAEYTSGNDGLAAKVRADLGASDGGRCVDISVNDAGVTADQYGAGLVWQRNSAVSRWVSHCQRGFVAIAGAAFKYQGACTADQQLTSNSAAGRR